ncbi:uncharacterized protein E0L32_004423 [Thyridium curvatum]|uniref:Allantoin permease n=1 Tax=Thyridium curvatum TaxID=1093900 RepID=A0A507B6Y1_9PEZI|nr:uncharacterized protein E0L32_004423 [Thyridium curvatum]TPX15443.1 hypothetical protein E0L32_004423 [Thyridium curvatum]
MGISAWLRRIELSNQSEWINEDIRPVPRERRTWTFLAFHNYWLLINCSIASYLTGSALVPLGLTWWQAIIAIVVGNILATIAILLNSLPGGEYHLGFPIFSRAVWGIWGSQFTVWNRIFLSFVWYGFQAWVGGSCIYLMLLSWVPDLEARIPNTIPEGTGMTTAQFVGYIIFSVISLPLLVIKIHRIQNFFYFASSVTFVFFVVLLIWALATMGPAGFGSTLDSKTEIPLTGGPKSTAWLMVYGVMSTIGSIAAGILNQNDFARFARRRSDAMWGQAVAFPLYGTACAVVGILVTAATQNRLGGNAVWNPPTLFANLLALDPSPGTRAAVFFVGLALVISQLGANIPGNALPGGMDLATVFPKYINIRRGAYIVAILSPIVNPWRLVNTATTFLAVLSGYSVFLAPMTGLMCAHYLLVCSRKVNVDGLYCMNSSSIYWYTKGVNWRAPVAWIVGSMPLLPGFIAAVDLTVTMPYGVTELYYLNYLYGFLSSGAVYALLHIVFPDARLKNFVETSGTPDQLRALYEERWDIVLAEHSNPEDGSELGPNVPDAKDQRPAPAVTDF